MPASVDPPLEEYGLGRAVYDASAFHLCFPGHLISNDGTSVANYAAAERIRRSVDVSVYTGLSSEGHIAEVRSRLDPAVRRSAWRRGTEVDPLELLRQATETRVPGLSCIRAVPVDHGSKRALTS